MMKKFWGNTAKNALWLMGEKIFNMLLSLITLALLARYLGPELYGTYNLAIALVSLFIVFSSLGMETVTIKHIVQKKDTEGTILMSSVIAKAVGSLLVILLSFILVIFIYPNDRVMIILTYIIASSYFFKSIEVLEFWAQSYHKSRLTSIVRMLVHIVTSVLRIIVVYLGLDLLYLGVIFIIEAVLLSIGFYIVYKKNNVVKTKWKFSFNYIKILFSESWYFIVSGIMVAVYTQLDKVILGNILSNFEVGLYVAAITLSRMWVFIPQAIITSMQPIIMKSKQEDEKRYYYLIEKLYSLIILISLIFSIVIIFIAEFVINILYGEVYLESSDLLVISIWAVGFSLLGTARRIWLVCEGIQKYAIYFLGIGAVLSIVLNIILIPELGVIGAAITWLLVEIVTAFIAPFFFKATRQNSYLILKALTFRTLR